MQYTEHCQMSQCSQYEHYSTETRLEELNRFWLNELQRHFCYDWGMSYPSTLILDILTVKFAVFVY